VINWLLLVYKSIVYEAFFLSTKTMTKIFVDEAIFIFVNEMKIVTIIQTISSTQRKRGGKLAYFR